MNEDISKLLDNWPYEHGKLTVRLITADDGEPRVQVRLDLGLLQMHVDGRPDGQRPHGCESYLEYFEQQEDESLAEEPEDPDPETSAKPEKSDFSLTEDDCRLLREEAVQYYHRYMALLALEDFDRVVRDTTRNLRVLDLCAKHGPTEADRQAMEQYRPYILMTRARALAGQAIKDNEPKAAIHAIDEGLTALRDYFAELGQPDLFDQSGEVELLKGMREALVPKLPVSPKSELRARLAKAIEQENYELAAILRDELKHMGD